jgi:autotransporter-associated beta strand protein
MILTGNNTYSGGTNVANGTLKVAADANLGTGNITGAALGTLEFTGTTTTAKSFAMGYGTIVADAGNTVTFNGSQVSSAYLAGAGTFATNATNGTQFSAVTSTPSATIDSNSGNDQFVNFDNSATLNVAAQINTNGTSTIKLFNGFTNEGSGQITVGSGSRVNVDRFTSYGTLTLNPATVSGQYTLLKNLGSTNLNFLTGSKTYIGTPATAGTIVAGVDLHGMNALVSGTTILVSSSPNVYATGALFVNNGFVASSGGSASLTVDGNNSTQGNVHGALYKGAGTTFVSIITQNGGAVQAGNSPGVDNFSQFTFGSGAVSNYVFAIDDATGVAGPHPDSQGHVDGWSMVNADNFTWTAAADHPLTVALQSLVNPTTVGTDVSGPMDNFDPRNSYVWEAIHWTCAYDGPSDAASLTDSTVFDNSGIVNSAGGKFSWQLDAAAKTLSLVYIPPPAVAGVQLNSGADGSVRSLTATFSTSVSFANGDAAAAFRLTNSDTGATVDLSATVSTDAQGRTVVTLTFSGGALAADHYRLSILGTAVTGADGAALDGSGTGTGSGIDYLGPTWTVGG